MSALTPQPVIPADKPRYRAALSAILFSAVAALCLSGCAGLTDMSVDPIAAQYGDRCYIEDSQFAFADQLYDKVGSVQLVEQELCKVYEWKRCEINEALYRLRKVHDLP